jgi:peptidoglycan/LPS O-acetylase OafA/YrhL
MTPQDGVPIRSGAPDAPGLAPGPPSDADHAPVSAPRPTPSAADHTDPPTDDPSAAVGPQPSAGVPVAPEGPVDRPASGGEDGAGAQADGDGATGTHAPPTLVPNAAAASATEAASATVPEAPEATAVPEAMPAAGGHPKASRLPCLDGVRAIAALGVIVVHVGLISGYNVRRGSVLGPYFARAEVGVTVFFLLSGFLVYRPFVAAHLDGRDAPALGTYLLRRALRIVPLYWVALTIVLFVHHRSPVDDVGDLVTYYGFGQIYRRGYETGGIQQAWSLCTLVAFYLAVPVLALAARAIAGARRPVTRLRVELVLAGAMVLIGYAYRWYVANDIPNREAVVDGRLNGLPIHADVFGLGMALAALYAWSERQPADQRFARAAGRVPPIVWWGVAAVAYWYVSVRVGLPLTAGAHDPGEWMAREVLYTIVSVALLMPAVFGPQDRGPVRWVLRWRPVAAVGLLTYGVFLWHEWAIDRWLEWRDVQPLNGWWPGMLAFVVAFTLAVSALTYWLIEKPFARFSARRRATPGRAPVPAA